MNTTHCQIEVNDGLVLILIAMRNLLEKIVNLILFCFIIAIGIMVMYMVVYTIVH